MQDHLRSLTFGIVIITVCLQGLTQCRQNDVIALLDQRIDILHARVGQQEQRLQALAQPVLREWTESDVLACAPSSHAPSWTPRPSQGFHP